MSPRFPRKMDRQNSSDIETSVEKEETEAGTEQSENVPAVTEVKEIVNVARGKKLALGDLAKQIKAEALAQDPWNTRKFVKGEHILCLFLDEEMITTNKGEGILGSFADLETGIQFRTFISASLYKKLVECRAKEDQRIISLYYGGKVKTKAGFEANDWKMMPLSIEKSRQLLSQLVDADAPEASSESES